jgi:putative lipase involved disintegration of autophagic bodies
MFGLLIGSQSFPFGWEDDDDGFRGQVFLSRDNSTIVLSIKGTTISGPTSKKDRFNDNLSVHLRPCRSDLLTQLLGYSHAAAVMSALPG